MTCCLSNKFADALARSLSTMNVAAEATGHDRWLVDYAGRKMSLRLENRWVLLSGVFARDQLHGAAVAHCAWECLERNATLPGAAKLVLRPGKLVIHAASEVFLDEAFVEDSLLLSSTMRDVSQSLAPSSERKVRADPAALASPQPDIAELCAAAGWPFHRRGDGSVSTLLEAGACNARAEFSWTDGLCASVTIPTPKPALADVSRQAIGVFLLRVCGAVRSVRPSVNKIKGHASVMLDVFLQPNCTPVALGHCLSALSLAAGMCVREVGLLAERPEFSQRYLAECGCSVPARGGTPGDSMMKGVVQ